MTKEISGLKKEIEKLEKTTLPNLIKKTETNFHDQLVMIKSTINNKIKDINKKFKA